jgi:hypothetical protein
MDSIQSILFCLKNVLSRIQNIQLVLSNFDTCPVRKANKMPALHHSDATLLGNYNNQQELSCLNIVLYHKFCNGFVWSNLDTVQVRTASKMVFVQCLGIFPPCMLYNYCCPRRLDNTQPRNPDTKIDL